MSSLTLRNHLLCKNLCQRKHLCKISCILVVLPCSCLVTQTHGAAPGLAPVVTDPALCQVLSTTAGDQGGEPPQGGWLLVCMPVLAAARGSEVLIPHPVGPLCWPWLWGLMEEAKEQRKNLSPWWWRDGLCPAEGRCPLTAALGQAVGNSSWRMQVVALGA